MLQYVTVGVSDMEKATAIYTKLLAPMGLTKLFAKDRIAFFGKDMQSPVFAICIPHNQNDPHPGNGNMFGFAPGSKEQVDELHALAISLGATDEGAPGQRLPNMFYGGYFRDLDGNKGVFHHFG